MPDNDQVEKRPCGSCRAPLEFHVGPNGNRIPLQRVRSVYYDAGGGEIRKLGTVKGVQHYVSHFETCPDPERFSRSRG